MNPSNFLKASPMGSVFRKSEHETIAQNIMVILKRTGDQWRELTWNEYFAARAADGATEYHINGEEKYFDDVIGYTKSEDAARLFAPGWKACKR